MIATPMTRGMSSHLATAQARAGVSGFPPPPLSGSNVLLRTLANAGSTDGLWLPDELRTGTQRDVWPGICMVSNGTNQAVTRPVTADPGTLTVACWAKVGTLGQKLMIGNRNGDNDQTWFFGTNGAGKVYLYKSTLTPSPSTTVSASSFPANTWTHVAATYDGASVKFYINGVLDSTVARTGGASAAGSHYWAAFIDGGGAGNWDGYLSDVYVAPNQVLTAAEIATLFAGGFVPITDSTGFFWPLNKPNCVRQDDWSGKGNFGTISNYAAGVNYSGADVPQQRMNTTGYSRSGSTNYLTHPNDFANAAWTKRGTCTVTANQEYHPIDGTLTADKIEGVNGTGNDIFNTNYQANGMPAGLRRRSVWIKRISTSGVLRMTDPLNGFGEFRIDLATIGGGWVLIDSAAAQLPAGVTRHNQEITYNANDGGIMFLALSGGPLSFYAAGASVQQGYLPGTNLANTAQDVDGNTREYVGPAPCRMRVKGSNCLKFNGTNQSINLGAGFWNTNGTQAMEVEFWLKTTATDVAIMSTLFGASLVGTEVLLSSTGQLQFWAIANYSTSDMMSAKTVAPVNDGMWHKCKVTYSGSKLASGVAFYVDGIRQASTAVADSLTGSTASASGPAYIGARYGTSLYLNGTLADFRLTIGSSVWRARMGEGSNSPGIYINDQFFAITNAGSNWTETQDVVNTNFRDGQRIGANLLRDSRALSVGFSAASVSRTEVGDMASGAKICRMAKTSTGGSASWNTTLGITPNNTQLTFSLAVKATATSDKATFGIYQDVAVWTHSGVSFAKISGPGTISQVQGALIQVTGLSLTEWTYVRVTATVGAGAAPAAYFYPDTHNSTTSGAAVDTSDWQVEFGGAVTPFFLTNNVAGNVRVPVGTTPMVAANGLPLTHPAGPWFNLPESIIDITGGVPGNTILDGQVIGDLDDYVAGRSVSTLQKIVTAQYERQFQLIEA